MYLFGVDVNCTSLLETVLSIKTGKLFPVFFCIDKGGFYMNKIDAHMHLVKAIAGSKGQGRLTPIGDGKAIWDDGEVIKLIPDGWGDENFLMEKALEVMEANDVQKAVLLQGTLNGYQNYYSYQAVKKYPEKFIAAFALDPFVDNAMAIVKRYVEQLGFRAIKFEISQGGGLHGFHHPFSLANEPKIQQIIHYIAQYQGFVVTVDYGNYQQISYQPEAIVTLAKRYPHVDFVVCHLSFPNADNPQILTSALNQFAPYNNIYVDISAIQDIEQEQGTKAYPFIKCQQDVKLAKEILGAKRIMWGTDSPWSATFNQYEQLYSWLEESGIFSAAELADIFYNNAEKVYFKQANVEAMKAAKE